MEGFSGTDSTDAKREAVPNFYSVYLKSEVRSEQDSNVYGDWVSGAVLPKILMRSTLSHSVWAEDYSSLSAMLRDCESPDVRTAENNAQDGIISDEPLKTVLHNFYYA